MKLQPDVWQKSVVPDGVNPFTDVAADAYYANAVLWAAENGITGGTTAPIPSAPTMTVPAPRSWPSCIVAWVNKRKQQKT